MHQQPQNFARRTPHTDSDSRSRSWLGVQHGTRLDGFQGMCRATCQAPAVLRRSWCRSASSRMILIDAAFSEPSSSRDVAPAKSVALYRGQLNASRRGPAERGEHRGGSGVCGAQERTRLDARLPNPASARQSCATLRFAIVRHTSVPVARSRYFGRAVRCPLRVSEHGRRELLPDQSDEGEAESAENPERDDPTLEGVGPAWPPLPEPVPPSPNWLNGRAFTAVWRDTLPFTVGGLMAAEKESPQLMPGAGWKSRPEPDSERDIDQAIAAKLHLGMRTLPILAEAQLGPPPLRWTRGD